MLSPSCLLLASSSLLGFWFPHSVCRGQFQWKQWFFRCQSLQLPCPCSLELCLFGLCKALFQPLEFSQSQPFLLCSQLFPAIAGLVLCWSFLLGFISFCVCVCWFGLVLQHQLRIPYVKFSLTDSYILDFLLPCWFSGALLTFSIFPHQVNVLYMFNSIYENTLHDSYYWPNSIMLMGSIARIS